MFPTLARPFSFLLYFFYTVTIGFEYVAVTAVNLDPVDPALGKKAD
jgi:hypothetical protein